MTTGQPIDLSCLLEPGTIAIVGATPNSRKVGSRPIPYLRRYGYAGQIYPINPHYRQIGGLTCYSALTATPRRPDLVIVAVPADDVLSALRDCVRADAGAAVVYTSGFGETGRAGRDLEDEIRQLVAETGLLVCGPNCQGVANLFNGLAANFSSAFSADRTVGAGPIGFATQSGLFGGILAHECRQRDLGLGYLVSTGNEAGVQFTHIVEHLAKDPRIKVIGGYVESVRSGQALRRSLLAARKADKPVVLCKVGRSAEGAKAAMSHTGSLTGDHRAYLAACRQWGAINVGDTEELFDVLEIFARNSRRTKGRRVGILTNSGGIGVLCADITREVGLELADFTSLTRQRLQARIPSFGSTANPVDITLQALTDAAAVGHHMRAIIEDPNTDMAMFVFGAQFTNVESVVKEIERVHRSSDKTVVLVWLASDPAAAETLRTAGIPVYPHPTRALRALRAVADHCAWQEATEAADPDNDLGGRLVGVPTGTLDETESLRLLDSVGIPVVMHEVATSAQEAAVVADRIGYPVVAKVLSPDLPHKSDAGAVAMGLTSAVEVERAFEQLLASARRYSPSARLHGVVIQKQESGAVELIVGVRRDPHLGAILMAGLGGSIAEALADTTLRVAPISQKDARSMLTELRAARLLHGFRNRPPVDVDAAADVLVKVGDLAHRVPGLQELDINPLLVGEHGAVAVDGLAVVGEPAGPPGAPPGKPGD